MVRYVGHVLTANARIFGPLTGTEALQIADLQAALVRADAGRVRAKAPPAHHDDLRRLWGSAPPDVALLAAVLWAGAFRHSDLRHVRRADVTAGTDGSFDVLIRLCKTTTRTGQPRVVSIVLPPPAARALEEALRSPLPWALFVPYPRFCHFVSSICPGLTAHSFRRGAVQAAMAAGVEDRAVMRLSGHASRDSLAAYAARIPATWRAQMMRASAATMW